MSDLDLSQGNLFSVFGELQATLGGLGDTMAAVNQRLSKKAPIPIDYTRGNNGVCGVGLTVVEVGVGGPDQGHLWLVRRLSVGALPVSTNLSGVSAYVFANSPPVGYLSNVMPVFGWETWTATVPNTSHWSDRQIMVLPGERLRVVFTGCTSGIQYQVEARVEDYEQAAFPETFTL